MSVRTLESPTKKRTALAHTHHNQKDHNQKSRTSGGAAPQNPRLHVTTAPNKWTPTNVNTATTMWRQGYSGGKIAAALGGAACGFTRNAVIGKLNRLGVMADAPGRRPSYNFPVGAPSGTARRSSPVRSKSEHAIAAQRAKQQRRDRIKAAVAAARDGSDVIPLDAVPFEERRNILNATPTQCRWCYGDPRSASHYLCNREKVPGLAFCELHAARVYVIASESGKS